MNFLAPFFLFGGLAVALPIVFHLIRRTTRERTAFSSLMFLLPTPPRLTRRSRLENILLLLLRCGVICLLALGFARPFFSRPVANAAASGSKRMIVLLDRSASMRRANLWADACARVEAALRKTSPGDQVAVFTFDRQLDPLVSFDQWNAAPLAERVELASRRLKDTAPGWAGTHLGDALVSAAEILTDTSGGKSSIGPREILLVSDLQEGCHLDQLQGYEWPKGVDLSLETVMAKHVNNASIQLVTGEEDSDAKGPPVVRVRVANSAESRKEKFQLSWGGAKASTAAGKPLEIYVPPGQSRIVPMPAPALQAPDRILLEGDEEDFDNTVFVIAPETSQQTVLYFSSDSPGDARRPLYFLQRAFQESRREAVRVLAFAPGGALEPSAVQKAALLMVADPLSGALAGALREQILAGKTLFLTLSSEALAPTLARLLGIDAVRVTEAKPNSYAMLAQIDFRHPLFAPFADPRFSDFSKIHFWRYRRVEAGALPGARVLASFDTGDPALVEIPVGKGRLLVLASGWQPEDSQLALSTKFVPLLYSLLEQSSAAAAPPITYQVGDVVPLRPAAEATSTPATIRSPDGSELNLKPGETNFSQTMVPGIYSVVSMHPERRFAVNLDGAESRTTPLPLDELERLGAPVTRSSTAQTREIQHKVRLQNAELENRQKIWRWLLLGTVGLLLVESWLAGRTLRRQTLQSSQA